MTLEQIIKQESIMEYKHQIAKEMLKEGFKDEIILKITKLSKEDFEKIKKDFEAENK